MCVFGDCSCCAGCDGDVLGVVDAGVADVDAGFADAGVADAGFADEDAGVVVGACDREVVCDAEDVEVPFVCEDDADWCSPRDQHRAYFDLAAGWSRHEDGFWIVEVRFWGDMLRGGDVERLESWGLSVNSSRSGVATDFPTGESPDPGCTNAIRVGEFDALSPKHSISFDPFGNVWCRACREEDDCELERECERWSVSPDGTTFRFQVPDDATLRFSVAVAGTVTCLPGGCVDGVPFLTPSRGGRADGVTFGPVAVAPTATRPLESIRGTPVERTDED